MEIKVEKKASLEQRDEAGMGPEEDLYGLFEGESDLEQGFGVEAPVPRRILIFTQALEEDFPKIGDRTEELRKTLLHEIGHVFGLSEEKLEELGY